MSRIPGQKSIDASSSEGFLSNARQRESRLSTLGKFVPRSMELICETLSSCRGEVLQRPVALDAQEFDPMPQPLA